MIFLLYLFNVANYVDFLMLKPKFAFPGQMQLSHKIFSFLYIAGFYKT